MNWRMLRSFSGDLRGAGVAMALLAVAAGSWVAAEPPIEKAEEETKRKGKGGKEDTRTVLFDGSDLAAWEFAEDSWYIDGDGVLTCRMEEFTTKKGETRVRGRGNIWSREDYGDFDLTISYKMSAGANSGVYYRVSNLDNAVHEGFEVQLMDNEGFQKTHGKKDARKLNGSFYDAAAPAASPENPPGEWNTLRLRCEGPVIQCWINGTRTFRVDVDDWTEAGKNPDGTTNKFKNALADLPRRGRIGLQNHGQEVWFRDISIEVIGD